MRSRILVRAAAGIIIVVVTVWVIILIRDHTDVVVQYKKENISPMMWEWADRCGERTDSISLLEFGEMLENNFYEELPFGEMERAIVFYENDIHTPFEGYQILVYKETSEKDILLGYVLWVEKETGSIYLLEEEGRRLLKMGVKGFVVPEEAGTVLAYEYAESDEAVSECLGKVSDFLKTEEGLANFKIRYDGVYSFLGREYRCVSLIEEINNDMIHTVQRYYIDLETEDFYQESAHIVTGERAELYYRGNVGDSESFLVDKVISNQEIEDTEYKIHICYPYIIYEDSPEIAAKMNQSIEAEIRKRCDVKNSSYDIAYEVKYRGEKYFSILFWGMCYDSGAYPSDIAFGLTYDMTTGQLSGIGDIIEEAELQHKLEQREFEQVYGMKIKYYESDVSGGEVNWFEKYLAGESIDEHGKHNTDFYLTTDKIGILYEVPHSFGDYIILEFEWTGKETESSV